MQTFPVRHDRRACMGFSLLETILVLILMGVLSAVAVARFTDMDADVRAAEDKLRVHLRHAQGRAMNSDVTWGVHSATGNEYVLFFDGDVTNTAIFSAEDAVEVSLPVTIGAFTVSFDEWGRPYDVANPEDVDPLDEDMVITATITITQDTGFIP